MLPQQFPARNFAREFRQPKQSNSSRAPAPVVNQQRGQQKGPAPRAGHANYTTMDEIPIGEEVLAVRFSSMNALLLYCLILEHRMIL
jgi:hypothetical protein